MANVVIQFLKSRLVNLFGVISQLGPEMVVNRRFSVKMPAEIFNFILKTFLGNFVPKISIQRKR